MTEAPESAAPPVDDPDDGLRRRLTPGRVAVVAAVAVAMIAALVLLTPDTDPAPSRPDTTPPLTTTAAGLGGLWPALAAGPTDLGYLTEKDRLRSCWPLGVPSVLGARTVIVDGRYGVVVATPDPDRPALVALTVFGRDCTGLDGGVIAETRVPRGG